MLNNPIRRHYDRTPERVVEVLGINDASVIIDFGCGPGFHVFPFARTAKQVIAVDLQEKMLEKARKYAQKNDVENKIRFLQSDGEEIPQLEDGSCDFVFLSHVYHEIADSSRGRVLSELRRVLKPGGKLAIMEQTKKMLVGPPAVNLEELKEELAQAEFIGTEIVGVSKNAGLVVAARGIGGAH